MIHLLINTFTLCAVIEGTLSRTDWTSHSNHLEKLLTPDLANFSNAIIHVKRLQHSCYHFLTDRFIFIHHFAEICLQCCDFMTVVPLLKKAKHI